MAQRGFNIDNFRAYINQNGVLRNNRFIVEIPLPRELVVGSTALSPQEASSTARNLELVCDTINWPSTSLQVYGVRRYGYGYVERKPTMGNFGMVQCTFISDQKTDVHKFFSEWIKLITNYDNSQGIRGATSRGRVPYEIGYKEEYTVDLKIRIYDVSGKEVRAISLRQAFPVNLADVSLSWGNTNELTRIPVAFTFMDWHEAEVKA